MALIKNPKFDLKLKYKRIFKISLILSLALIVAAFKLSPNPDETIPIIDEQQIVISLTDIPDVTEPEPPKEKPKEPELVQSDSPNDNDIIIEPSELDPDANVDDPPPPYEDNDTDVDEPIPPYYEWAEIQPQPIGGIEEIQKKVVYPELAVKVGIQGKVTVLAYVNADGGVDKVEIVKGIGAGCDEAAMDAVMKTEFSPAMQGSRTVPCKVRIPIVFQLN